MKKGMTLKRLVEYYLRLVSKAYSRGGRYRYTTKHKEKLREALIKKYPEFADVVETVYFMVEREIDESSVRWPERAMIMGLSSKVIRTISPIPEGVVIDHLPKGAVYDVIDILRLRERKTGRVSSGDGLRSSRREEKGILKIEGIALTDYELNLVALVAPGATLNVIRDWRVAEKRDVELPEVLEGIIKCPNLMCVTNMKKHPPETKYYYDGGREGKFRCRYCEGIYKREDIISSTFHQQAS